VGSDIHDGHRRRAVGPQPGTAGGLGLMPHGRRSQRFWVAITLCLVLLVGIVVLIAQRRAVARSLIDSQLRSLGLQEIEHEVERFGLREFGVRNFRVGNERGLSVDRIDARYSLPSLLAGRLESLSVSGVRLRGAFEDGRVTFGALDSALADGGGTAGGGAPLALPAWNIAIDDVEVSVETPEGLLSGSFAANLRELDEHRIAADATVQARHPRLEASAKFDLAGTRETFDGDLSLELRSIAPAAGSGSEARHETATMTLAAAINGSEDRIDVTLDALPIRYATDDADAALRFSGEIPATTISIPRPVASAPVTLRAPDTGGHVNLPGLELALADISLEAALDPESWFPTGDLTIADISDTRTPARFMPGSITGRIATTAAGLEFDLQARIADTGPEVHIRGSYDRESSAGTAQLRLEPLEFSEGGLQPAQLSPRFAESIESASGAVEARGTVDWSPDAPLRASLHFVARDLSMTTEFGSFEQLNAAIRVDGPSPYSSPPQQLLSMARIDFGLELTNGLVALRLLPDGRIDIESAEWSLAGGKVRTRGVVDPGTPTQKLVLDLEELELAKLLELADLDGLSGNGLLSGKIPIVRRGSKLEIRDGKLTGAAGGGLVQYLSSSFNAGSVDSNQEMNVVFKLLENFHYETIEAKLDGDTDESVTLSIRLLGANPDYLDGHPFDYTLTVDSRLVDLLRKATAVYRIPDEIQKRIEEMSGGLP
jgi:hypothetical protein